MNKRFAILWLLYAVQGLPFGFQATALPILLREADASLTLVSLAGLVSTPWLLKPLWAPWVDRSVSRKRWLLPMQATLALAVAVAGWVGDARLAPLIVSVAVMNLFAATLDIAVDGLAIDMLGERDLGLGNAAQVVGYKIGMLVGGGLLLWVSARIGHPSAMFAMATLIVIALAVTWRFDEPPRSFTPVTAVRQTYRQAMGSLFATLRAPETRWIALAALTYKTGEALADTMFKPFMVDAGFSREQIGLWLGTWGMLMSLAGSLAGGWLASRWRIWHALALLATLRVLPLAGQWWLAVQGAPSASSLIAITCAEHFVGGALTTAMFAMMMLKVNRHIGATHFTALAAIEVIGKSIPSLASGPLTERLGYATTFGASVVLSVGFLAVLPTMRPTARA